MKSYRKQLPENIAAKGGFYKLLNNGMYLVLQDCTSVIPLHNAIAKVIIIIIFS